MNPWSGVLNIPEGKSGEYEIKHSHKPAGTRLPTTNARTRFIGGQQGVELIFEHPTRWHSLVHSRHGVWMTDLPIEQAQHDRELDQFCGTVLVGGLGLGYALEFLARRDDVERVDVVEISQDVANLVWPHVSAAVRAKTELHVCDLFEFLKEPRTPCDVFDFAFYDIWQSDGQHTFFKTVLPLRKLSRNRADEIVCWNEDVMRGQLYLSLQSRMMQTLMGSPPGTTLGDVTVDMLCGPAPFETKNPFEDWDWARPFWETVRERGITDVNKEFAQLAQCYSTSFGIWDWEIAQHFADGGES